MNGFDRTMIRWIGFLSGSSEFNNAMAELGDAKPTAIRFILHRFYMYAHFYSVVLPLAFLLLRYGVLYPGEGAEARTLLLVAVGSLSMAFFEIFTGGIASRMGAKSSLIVGSALMIALLVLYIVCFLTSLHSLFFDWAPLLAIICQLLVGLPLAMINGPDSTILKAYLEDQGVNVSLQKKLEVYGTSAKYFGGGMAILVGTAIFSVPIAFINNFGLKNVGQAECAISMIVIFSMAIISQVRSISLLRHLPDSDIPQQELNGRKEIEGTRPQDDEAIETRPVFLHVVQLAWQNRQLLGTSILSLGILEGCLLFTTSFLALDALIWMITFANSIDQVLSRLMIITLIPVIFFAIECCAFLGSRKASKEIRCEQGAPSDRQWLENTLVAIFTFCVVFVLHLVVIRAGFLLPGVSLAVFFAMRVIRAFATPQLRNEIQNAFPADQRHLRSMGISLASSIARGCHIMAALAYFCVIKYLQPQKSNSVEAEAIAGSLVMFCVLACFALMLAWLFVTIRVPSMALFLKYLKGYLSSKEHLDAATILAAGLVFVCITIANPFSLSTSKFLNIEFNAGSMIYAIGVFLVLVVQNRSGWRTASKVVMGVCLSYFVIAGFALVASQLPVTGAPRPDASQHSSAGRDATPTSSVATSDEVRDAAYAGSSSAPEGKLKSSFVFGGERLTDYLVILVASFAAFTASQVFSIYVFHVLNVDLKMKGFWIKSGLAIFFSQGVDTFLFVSIPQVFAAKFPSEVTTLLRDAPDQLNLFINVLLAKWIVILSLALWLALCGLVKRQSTRALGILIEKGN